MSSTYTPENDRVRVLSKRFRLNTSLVDHIRASQQMYRGCDGTYVRDPEPVDIVDFLAHVDDDLDYGETVFKTNNLRLHDKAEKTATCNLLPLMAVAKTLLDVRAEIDLILTDDSWKLLLELTGDEFFEASERLSIFMDHNGLNARVCELVVECIDAGVLCETNGFLDIVIQEFYDMVGSFSAITSSAAKMMIEYMRCISTLVSECPECMLDEQRFYIIVASVHTLSHQCVFILSRDSQCLADVISHLEDITAVMIEQVTGMKNYVMSDTYTEELPIYTTPTHAPGPHLMTAAAIFVFIAGGSLFENFLQLLPAEEITGPHDARPNNGYAPNCCLVPPLVWIEQKLSEGKGGGPMGLSDEEKERLERCRSMIISYGSPLVKNAAC